MEYKGDNTRYSYKIPNDIIGDKEKLTSEVKWWMVEAERYGYERGWESARGKKIQKQRYRFPIRLMHIPKDIYPWQVRIVKKGSTTSFCGITRFEAIKNALKEWRFFMNRLGLKLKY
jgi:hypothetical protein